MLKTTSYKCQSHRCLCAVVLLGSYAICWADTIVLKEGQTLTGDILAEKKTQLIVDIGVMVVTIPKENILKYESKNICINFYIIFYIRNCR